MDSPQPTTICQLHPHSLPVNFYRSRLGHAQAPKLAAPTETDNLHSDQWAKGEYRPKHGLNPFFFFNCLIVFIYLCEWAPTWRSEDNLCQSVLTFTC